MPLSSAQIAELYTFIVWWNRGRKSRSNRILVWSPGPKILDPWPAWSEHNKNSPFVVCIKSTPHEPAMNLRGIRDSRDVRDRKSGPLCAFCDKNRSECSFGHNTPFSNKVSQKKTKSHACAAVYFWMKPHPPICFVLVRNFEIILIASNSSNAKGQRWRWLRQAAQR